MSSYDLIRRHLRACVVTACVTVACASLGVILVGVYMPHRAYATTFELWRAADNSGEQHRLRDFEAMIAGRPVKRSGQVFERFGEREILYTWYAISESYTIRLSVEASDENPEVWMVEDLGQAVPEVFDVESFL